MASLIARGRRSLAHLGWRRSALGLGRWLGFRLRHGFRAPAPHWFDLEFQVDTASLEGGANLGERKGTVAGVPYGAVDPFAFADLMRHVDLGASPFVFLDFGCGQGRALLLAAEYPFRQVLGVEYDHALQQAAQRNLQLFRSPRQACHGLAAVWEDAAQWKFPVAPSVFYFNEPFFEPLMRVVAERIRRSLAAAPRPAYVMYLGDWYRSVWEEPGDFEILHTRGDDRLYRWVAG